MPDTLDLSTFIKRYRILVLSFAATCCVIATTLLVLSPKRYESFTSLYVMSTDPLLGMFQTAFEGIGLPSGSDDKQGYILAVLHSADLKAEVLKKLDQKQLAAFWGETEEADRTIENSRERMNELVRVDDATSFEPVTVVCTTEDPELSFALAKNYLELLLARVDVENRSQELFLKGQLANARADLKKAATRFQQFQEDNELPFTMEAQGEAEFTALSQLYSEYAKAAVELSATEEQLQAPGDLEAQIQLTSARAGYKARADMLKKMLDEQSMKLEKMPSIMKEYTSMQRDIAEKSKIVETLAAQYELAKFQVKKTTSPYKIIEQPFLPQQPVRKPFVPVLISGWFIGAILGIGLALLRENFAMSRTSSP
ncbi:MAG: hypothetical protein AMXMBFR33_42950 [Candidatus Xenobia bacterium]|jgi:uncharacterized protein involved in exopolysaccharide biosynthesis